MLGHRLNWDAQCKGRFTGIARCYNTSASQHRGSWEFGSFHAKTCMIRSHQPARDLEVEAASMGIAQMHRYPRETKACKK
jgi:hypothetical protein